MAFNSWLQIASAGGLALLFALYITPVIMRAAERYGIVDRPDGKLKTQANAIPYLGGLGLFLAFLAAIAIVNALEPKILAILLSASIIVCFGLVDDLGTLVPKDKLIGQIIASLVLVRAGVHIEIATVPEPFDTIASVFWLVAIINAFNIIDVHDGLCASVGAVAALFFAIFAFIAHAPSTATLCVALFGALVGYLRYNRPPARIYLGDTGSMLIGLLLGAMAMISDYSTINPLASMFSPLAILAIPLFDIVLVVLARLRHRLPIYYGSPDHFAVRLRKAGMPAAPITIGAAGFGIVFGSLGLLAAFVVWTWALVVIGLSVVLALAALFVLWRFDPRNLEPHLVPISQAPGQRLDAANDATAKPHDPA